MREREEIIQELWSRLAGVPGVAFTARNPKDPPSIKDMPCIQFFETEDTVESSSRRGGSSYPNHRRRMSVVVEAFMAAEEEGSSSKELGTFVQNLKKTLYVDGVTLGGLCEIREVRTGRILRPPIGGAVVGVGLTFEIRYVEDVGRLFQ